MTYDDWKTRSDRDENPDSPPFNPCETCGHCDECGCPCCTEPASESRGEE